MVSADEEYTRFLIAQRIDEAVEVSTTMTDDPKVKQRKFYNMAIKGLTESGNFVS